MAAHRTQSRVPSDLAHLGDSAALQKRAAVLTKAVLRASDRLGLTGTDLAKVLGLSTSTVSRMTNGEWTIQPGTKPWELAALFVRLFRSLDALVGGSERHVKDWFRSENLHLTGSPAKLIFSVEGLINVARYLDALRGAQ